MTRNAIAALAFTMSLAAACGSGSGGDGGGSGSGNNNGSGTIGTGGGTVSLPSGPTVLVPAGALPANTPITVAASTTAAPGGAVTPVYQFGPDGTTFTTPVKVSFAVPAGTAAANVAIYWTKPGSATLWDVLPATVSGTVASADVTHFSAGFVGAACAAGAACTPTNACHAGVWTCNGTPVCADAGTNVADGTACGTGLTCTAGTCAGPTCVAGQTCTPTGAPVACKAYATACDASGAQSCGVSGNLADGTACGTGLICTAGTCSPPPPTLRTVTGAFQVTHWPDSGVKATVVGPPPGGETATKIFVPDGSPAGYTVISVTQSLDGTFTASGVPTGTYFLQVDVPNFPVVGGVQISRPIPTLYQFTTSAPRFETVDSARPDLVYPTLSTPVTLALTNLAPSTTTNQTSGLLISGSQADVDILTGLSVPAGATTRTTSVNWRFSSGLPSAASGDVLYVYQRQTETVGSGPSAATHALPTRFAKLTAYPAIVNGAPATLDVPLVPAPAATMGSNVKISAFDALLPEMGPGATPSSGSGFSWAIFSSPHTALGPDRPNLIARNGFLNLNPGTPDTDYGPLTYADFLDPLWKPWRQVVYPIVGTVTAPGRGPVDVPLDVGSFVPMSPTPPNPIAPVLGPVTAPRVAGQDAATNLVTPVGLQPIISWAPPALGTATSYFVEIAEMFDGTGATGFTVINATIYGGTSFKVPQGLLKAGSTYVAFITALDQPWDALDGNPWGSGTPAHWVPRLTGTFTP